MAGPWWPASLPSSLSSRPMGDAASKIKGRWYQRHKTQGRPLASTCSPHMSLCSPPQICTFTCVHMYTRTQKVHSFLYMLIVWFSSLRAWSWVWTLDLLILELCFSPPLQTLKEGVIHGHTQGLRGHCLQRWLCFWHHIKHSSGVLCSHYSH